ncbi:MAG: DEAD/DEAH box helicase [Candidatus Micrarchaeota archaeon]|nr:DEAD/DEAH box helicase [Candidatus Micrarchaeota archaeon]
MNLDDRIVSSLDILGYQKPTDVQAKVIPLIIEGKDIMARSQTGTGKTAAFGVGIAQRLLTGKTNSVLILTPTRELAVQVQKEIRGITRNTSIKTVCVYGGKSIENQAREIEKGVDILVATPGRLLDLKERRIVDLKYVDFVILDEADRMLDMGFIDDMEKILHSVSQERITCLFSATLDNKIHSIAERYMHIPEVVELGDVAKAVNISEESIYLERHEKVGMLRKIQRDAANQKILVFSSTKASVDYLWKKLMNAGIRAGRMHGDMSQSQRENSLRDFKEGKTVVMCATDVAARGIHVEDIAIIVNYDIARDKETHIHRIGRTGRMGKEGKAITFVEKPSANPPPPRYSGGGNRGQGHHGQGHAREGQRDSRRPQHSQGSHQGGYGRERKRPEKKEFVDKGDSWDLQMKEMMSQGSEDE